jgi:hypothetical protein
MRRLSWSEVSARRLERHGLMTPSRDAQPADLVGAICGAHAQVMSAAELSIGVRSADTTQTDVREALWTERSLVKTFGPRGTVHLLPTRDLPMWTGALSALPASAGNGRSGPALLSPGQIDIVVEAIADALADAELTVDELTEAVVERTGSWAGDPVMEAFQVKWPRWRWATDIAANRGALCFGPNRGRKVTYTNPHRWLSGFRRTDGHTALAELVKRYLAAYGPATPQHFAQWLAAPRPWASELFDSLSDELERVDVDGTVGWLPAGDTTPALTAPAGVRLLPYFDAYTVGFQPRERLFPGRAAERAMAGGQAGNFPVLLIDATVAGVWHQQRSGRKLDITVEPLDALTAAQRRGLDDQVNRIGQFFGATPRLTIGTVTVGAHA